MPDANITKSALARSMKKLMGEKDFQKISVTDICEMCGMNRKSFYYHFKDKFDLMNWIFYTDFVSMVMMEKISSGWDLLTAVMKLFYNDQPFYKSALKTEGQNSFSEYFHESMFPIVVYMFEDSFDNSDTTETMINIFCDFCLIASIRWLERGCKESPVEFVETVKKMILQIATSISSF